LIKFIGIFIYYYQ